MPRPDRRATPLKAVEPLRPEPDRLLTLSEVAKRLACCERTVRRSIDRGFLRPFRLGSRIIRVAESELQRFIREGTEDYWPPR